MTTGVADPSGRSSLHVYPNPVHDQLSWSWDQSGPGPLILEFFDLAGRSVRRFVTVPAGGSSTLDLKGLATGLYILRIEGSGSPVEARVIKY
jgi:hypothetical protein